MLFAKVKSKSRRFRVALASLATCGLLITAKRWVACCRLSSPDFGAPTRWHTSCARSPASYCATRSVVVCSSPPGPGNLPPPAASQAVAHARLCQSTRVQQFRSLVRGLGAGARDAVALFHERLPRLPHLHASAPARASTSSFVSGRLSAA